jgi:hypothetical protein
MKYSIQHETIDFNYRIAEMIRKLRRALFAEKPPASSERGKGIGIPCSGRSR